MLKTIEYYTINRAEMQVLGISEGTLVK